MFTDKENQLLFQIVQQHIDSLESKLQSENIDKEAVQKMQDSLKTAVNIKMKMGSSVNKETAKKLETVNKDDLVLVIDDDVVCREVTNSLLGQLGYKNVKSTFDGYQAINTIKQHKGTDDPVKLILCDWNMPNMSGLELLNIVRKDETLGKLPFYLVTSNHDKAHIVTALKAGVTGYLVKPLSAKNIGEKLSQHLSS